MRKFGYLSFAAAAALSVTMVGSPAFADPEPDPTPTVSVEPTVEPTVDPTVDPTVEPTVDPTPTDAPIVNVLTAGSLGGANIAVGDVLTADIQVGKSADFDSRADGSGGGIQCAISKFTAAVVDNPPAPGVATESTTGQTFESCKSTIVGVNKVLSVTVNNAPFATTVASGTGTVTVTGTATAPIQTTLRLETGLGTISCVYRANGGSITGVSDNTDNSISFTKQQFNRSSGNFLLCPTNGFFTARYINVTDNTVVPAAKVFTN